ncbi:hypothetical protein BJX70DRAFT_140586 [Aspergillus crustosus]
MFCNYRQQHEQKLESILVSILRQLIQALPVIPEDLYTLYQRRHRNGPRLQIHELLNLILTICKVYSRVYIVIDALDECTTTSGTRDSIVSHLLDLQQKCNLSLLATSRHIPEIAAKFQSFPTVEIRARDSDVKLYVEAHVLEVSNCVRTRPELSKLIIDEIVKSVNGMFLLAKLYLDSVKGKSSPKAIKIALSKLKTGSDAYSSAYRDAMDGIEHQILDQAHLANQLLSWLVCALRPLTLTEIQHALAVEVDEDSFNKDNLPDVEDLISACAGLMTYNERSHIIELVHYTAKEYFDKEWTTWFPDAHRDLGQTCLSYLNYDETADRYEEKEHEYPLYDYAVAHWAHRVKKHPLELERVLELLENNRKWVACIDALIQSYEWFNGASGRPIRAPTALHLKAVYDLEHETKYLLEQNYQVDVYACWVGTPLWAAVGSGSEAVVRLLLQYGANPNHRKSEKGTYLALAAKMGHNSLVKLFLELGLDPEYSDNKDRTPLLEAASNGHLNAAKLLLDAQASINTKDTARGRTALDYAVMCGCLSVARFLLERGANTDWPRD